MKYILYSCFLFLIILFFSYNNSLHSVENFTPKIRQMYRPIIRNTRLVTENFYNKNASNISNLFRKFSII
jgi:hypothetical protein